MHTENKLDSSALAQPTRARLFGLLQELKTETATDELADHLDLHVNGVRRHLEHLRQAGLVERRRPREGRGRPRDLWSIAPDAEEEIDAVSSRHYADLAGWLADVLASPGSGAEQIEKVGQEIGRELARASSADSASAFEQILSAQGFRPQLEHGPGDVACCRLRNCPYSEAVLENPGIVCGLHRGMTAGLLQTISPKARMTRFEPRDPKQAGCIVEVTGAGWEAPTVDAER